MKSIVAQTENQLRPLKVSRLISAMKGSGKETLRTSSVVCNVVTHLMGGGQVECRWTPHLASLVSRPDAHTQLLWRPYVSFNTRLTRKLSGAMERRGSSINFLGRYQARKGVHPSRPSTCVLPVKTRHAPKTVQGRKWPIWRQSSVRPLLLPSSNLWTGVLSQRFYVPRLRPADDEGVERRAVPRLRVTREESEEEEQQLQRRRDGSRLRNYRSESSLLEREVDYSGDQDRQENEQDQGHRQPYVPSELMTPGLATKWLTTDKEPQDPSVRLTTQVWVRGNQRRYRSRRPSGRKSQVMSELEGWRKSANHQPVPIFQGHPAEQEHLRHASCKTSARSMKDIQEGIQMVWEPKKMTPWSRAKESTIKPGVMPTIRAAKSALMMAQESRGKQNRLITKELVYRPSAAAAGAEEEEDPRRRAVARTSTERALLQQHLADLLPVLQSQGSFRIGYQRHAPTRQLLEQGKCHVSLRREQFLHLQSVRPNSLIQASDLEARESPRLAVTTLHRKDGAKRPCPVDTVVKPSLLTLIRRDAATWDLNGRRVEKRSFSVGVRPKKEASLRRLVRNASSLEALFNASPTPTPTATATPKPAATATAASKPKPTAIPKPIATSKPKPPSLVSEYRNVVSKKLPQVSSKLDICKAAHPFMDLEQPRIKEKEVATSWKQAHVARNYKYEASTSYRRRAQPGKQSSTKDMTEGYFLAKRSSSTAIKEQQASSKKIKPPRQPSVSPKVQVPKVIRKQKSQEKLKQEATQQLWR